jgi:hypothetical protein
MLMDGFGLVVGVNAGQVDGVDGLRVPYIAENVELAQSIQLRKHHHGVESVITGGSQNEYLYPFPHGLRPPCDVKGQWQTVFIVNTGG